MISGTFRAFSVLALVSVWVGFPLGLQAQSTEPAKEKSRTVEVPCKLKLFLSESAAYSTGTRLRTDMDMQFEGKKIVKEDGSIVLKLSVCNWELNSASDGRDSKLSGKVTSELNLSGPLNPATLKKFKSQLEGAVRSEAKKQKLTALSGWSVEPNVFSFALSSLLGSAPTLPVFQATYNNDMLKIANEFTAASDFQCDLLNETDAKVGNVSIKGSLAENQNVNILTQYAAMVSAPSGIVNGEYKSQIKFRKDITLKCDFSAESKY